MRNLTVDELAEMFVTAMLQDGMLNKTDLLVKAKAFIRTFVDLKNVPKDYNAMPKKNVQAARLRTIEQKDAEIKFWLTIVRELDPDNIQKYYKQQEAMLVAKGFKTI